ncbi:hypothetical protein KAR91_23280 [Candidatus Pacearchaeota archaeon]|nr:hypothetical protein [Candidatus Pacearchaeota archaeon]
MKTAWFICPVDSRVVKGWPPFILAPAMKRYKSIHGTGRIPNADGCQWKGDVILGGKCLCKITAPNNMFAQIRNDPDFDIIPKNIENSNQQQAAMRAVLLPLGYSVQELNDTGWNLEALVDFLTSVTTVYKLNANKDGADIQPGRRIAKGRYSWVTSQVPAEETD